METKLAGYVSITKKKNHIKVDLDKGQLEELTVNEGGYINLLISREKLRKVISGGQKSTSIYQIVDEQESEDEDLEMDKDDI